MKIKDILNKIMYMFVIGFSICVLFFVIGCSWIGYEVKKQCVDATREYGGDCVEALITTLNDENNGFRDRNDAIWALGELGDSRALPVLQGYYTGDIPEREPLDKVISQYELKKSVNLLEGGINISAFIWRSGIIK